MILFCVVLRPAMNRNTFSLKRNILPHTQRTTNTHDIKKNKKIITIYIFWKYMINFLGSYYLSLYLLFTLSINSSHSFLKAFHKYNRISRKVNRFEMSSQQPDFKWRKVLLEVCLLNTYDRVLWYNNTMLLIIIIIIIIRSIFLLHLLQQLSMMITFIISSKVIIIIIIYYTSWSINSNRLTFTLIFNWKSLPITIHI